MAKKKSSATDISAAPVSAASVAAQTARKRMAAARPKAGNGNARHDPTHDEIAEAAYHRYLSRQGAGGSDFDDWVQAERDLRSRSAANPKSQ
jgi:hypothetical protein